MIMLYAVRIKLVFISSVTAMTPLRTISMRTGVMRLFALVIALPDGNDEIAERIDRQCVARHQHCRGCMLFDEGRPDDAIASQESNAAEDWRFDEISGETSLSDATTGA